MKSPTFILLLTGAMIIAFQTGCREEDKPDATPPVLSVTPVDISQVTHIIVFGADLSAHQKNPAFEYYLSNSGAEVRSVCKGNVENIFMNDNFPDYEVWIRPSANSVWKIIYDHVLNLEVSAGDPLNPGDVLGSVGDQNRTELQINKIEQNSELSYCPFDFATDEFINQHKSFTETWCMGDTVVP
jgi:hypothetical protein